MSYCEFYDEHQHTARKEHICEMCGGVINVGEKYWNEVGKYEGEFFSRALHNICHQMEREFCSEVDCEFSWDEITEYIQETYCTKCPHHWRHEDEDDYVECTTTVHKCPFIRKAMEADEDG